VIQNVGLQSVKKSRTMCPGGVGPQNYDEN
jgi:hypothetical protein